MPNDLLSSEDLTSHAQTMIGDDCDALLSRSTKTLAIGGLAGICGQALSPCLSLCWRGVLARHLGLMDFGVWALGYSIITAVHTLLTAGLSSSISKHIAEFRAKNKTGLETASLLLGGGAGLLGGVLVAVLAPPIAKAYHLHGLTTVLFVLAFVIPFTSFLTVLVAVCVGYQDVIARPAFLDAGLNLARLICVWIAASVGMTLLSSSVAFSAASLFMGVIATGYLWKRHVPTLHFEHFTPHVVMIATFALPIIGTEVFEIIMSRTDTLMLGYLVGSGAVSHYDVSNTIARVALFPYFGLTVLFLPQITDLVVFGNRAAVSRFYALVTKWALMAGLVASILLYGCSTQLLALVFGKPFAAASWVFRVNLIGNLLLVTFGPTAALLMATNRIYRVMWATLAGCVFNIALNLMLIPLWAATGAAVATSISQVAVNGYLLYFVRDCLAVGKILKTSAALWGILAATVFFVTFLAGRVAPVWAVHAIAAALFLPLSFSVTHAPEDQLVVNLARRTARRLVGLEEGPKWELSA